MSRDVTDQIADSNEADRREQARAFFLTQFARADAGFVTVTVLPSATSAHVPVVDVDELVDSVMALDTTGADVFYGVNLRKTDLGEHKRGGKKSVLDVRHLWLDLDVGPDGHKAANCPPTANDALGLLEDAQLPDPSVVVSTGGGLHLYWQLGHAVQPALGARLCKSLQQRVIAAAAAKGWHVDDTSSEDRVLRVPGTSNRKLAGRPRPVELISAVEQTFTLEELGLGPQLAASSKASAPTRERIVERDATKALGLDGARSKLARDARPLVQKLLRGGSLADTERDAAMQSAASIVAYAAPHDDVRELAELFRASVTVWANEPADTDRPHLTADEEMDKVVEKLTRAQRDALADDAENREAREAFYGAAATLPEIKIGVDEHRMVDESIEALGGHPDVFQRAGGLVEIQVEEDKPKALIRASGSPKIVSVTAPRVRDMLTRCATFSKWLKTEEGFFPAAPPENLAAQIMARPQKRGIRNLEAIVETPTLLADGRVLTEPGHHPDSGILVWHTAPRVSLADAPSLADAQLAAAELLDLSCDVPFETPEHRAASLALMLTPLARHAFAGPAPLHLVESSIRGSGKGLLIQVASRIVWGRDMTATTPSNSNEEMRKVITSCVMAGYSAVLFDNAKDELGTASLDMALTATTWGDRILAKNRMVEIPLTTTFYATGNNLRLNGDLPRRTLDTRLQPDVERPELRVGFKHPNLLAHVEAHRARYLSAALTILRAYILAGRPSRGLQPWGSFEGWAELVVGAIHWVLGIDIGETRVALEESADHGGGDLGDLLLKLRAFEIEHGGAFVAREVHDKIKAHPFSGPEAELSAALAALAEQPAGIVPTVQHIGKVFSTHRGQIRDGLRLVQAGRKTNRGLPWSVLGSHIPRPTSPGAKTASNYSIAGSTPTEKVTQ